MSEKSWLKRIWNCNLQGIKEKENNEMLGKELLALSGVQVPNL
jgi:hypothetical protein